MLIMMDTINDMSRVVRVVHHLCIATLIMSAEGELEEQEWKADAKEANGIRN